MVNPNSDSKPPISSDRPIRTLAEDRFGLRESFVPRLARVAVEWPQADGLVVALDGEWGIGKTSILYMLKDYIDGQGKASEAERRRHCRLVTFNPWFYDDPATLAASFFATLAAELGEDEAGPWKDVARDLKKIGRFLAIASRGISFFGVSADGTKVLDAIRETADAGSEFAELLDQGERKLVEARRNVEEALNSYGASGGRLLIVLDDVDRLAKDEIIPLLRLLRIVADLPFVTILVAMDQRRIREQLGASSEPLDEEYLEKMVQVTVPVPPPDPDRFSELLQEELHAILGEHWQTYPEELTPKRYGGYPKPLELLLTLMDTPRDLARFGNGLRVLLLADPQPRDLDPVDAALISAVHVFHPDLYERIRNNKPFLTRSTGFDVRDYVDRHQGRQNQILERRANRLREIVHGTESPASAPSLDNIVEELFGNLLKEERGFGDELNEAVARRRIRTPDAFDRYFGLDGVPAVISRRELERVARSVTEAASAGDINQAAEILRTLFAGREQNAAIEVARDLKVHLRALRAEPMRVFGDAILQLGIDHTVSEPVLPDLLIFALRHMGVLHDRPRDDAEERLRSASELLEHVIARLPSVIDSLFVLEEAQQHGLVHVSSGEPLEKLWLARFGTDVRTGSVRLPEDAFSRPGRGLGRAIRLCTLAAFRGEAELVREPADYLALYLSEHPDDVFAFLGGAAEGAKLGRPERSRTEASETEPADAREGLQALFPSVEPIRQAIAARLAAGNIASADAEYLQQVKEQLESDSGNSSEQHASQRKAARSATRPAGA